MIEGLPAWLQVIVIGAAVATAGWTLYRKVLAPIAQLIVLLDDALPIVQNLIVNVEENGGEGTVTKHFQLVKRIDRRVGQIDSRMEQVERRLDALEQTS